jgi:chromosome segregation ATPase
MSLCAKCDDTGVVRNEQGPAGATYTVLVPCPRCQSDTVTALHALAQENERLKDTLELKLGEAFAEHVALEAHMSELEAERDSLKIAENHHHEEFARIEAELGRWQKQAEAQREARQAIRAKTIEKCAKICDRYVTKTWSRASDLAGDLAAAIRALAKTDESKT